MELIKVTNAGLKLTDGPTIPVIRAVVSDLPGNHNQQDCNDLMLEIYNQAYGSVALSGYFEFFPQPDPVDLIYETGTTTYGDADGIHLVRTVSNSDSGTNRYQNINYYLYRDNERLSQANVYTGYSTFEYTYMVIITDENDNIYPVVSGYGPSGINVRSDHELGIHVNGESIVCGVWEDGEYVDHQGSWDFASTGYDIKENIVSEINPSENSKDPYGDDGYSEGAGGNGNLDGTGDDIDIPGLPTLSATDTGFISLFNPSLAELKNLASYMWTGLFDVNTLRKLFADPMDCILGLSLVPVAVPNGGTREVSVGNISTGINMTIAARQFVEVDCGSINVNEYWGAYLDYEPYTKAEIYLPYIGTHPIAIDDIMGKTVKVVYHVDIMSGSCTAYVKCGGSVLYSFIGQCSLSIPITGNDWTNVINGALNIATSIGTMVATGGASAPTGASEIASTAINSLKPSIEKSGSMSGTGGMMAVQTPYLILTRPRQALPQNQNKFMGYPSFITSNLSALSGFTVMEHIHLHGMSATDEELREIESLLKEGVIL